MLILSRRPGDAIVIDGGIRIVVLASDKRGVRIGIEAPAHVSIVREEIVAQIVDQNRRANASPEAAALVGGLVPAARTAVSPAEHATPPSPPSSPQNARSSSRIPSLAIAAQIDES